MDSNEVIWERDKDLLYDNLEVRNIYVLGTTWQDMQLLLEHLLDSKYVVSAHIDDALVAIPETATAIYGLARSEGLIIDVMVDAIQVRWHFSREYEIDMTFWPGVVKSPDDLRSIYDFMRYIAEILQTSVLLTLESSPNKVLIAAKAGQPDVERVAPKNYLTT